MAIYVFEIDVHHFRDGRTTVRGVLETPVGWGSFVFETKGQDAIGRERWDDGNRSIISDADLTAMIVHWSIVNGRVGHRGNGVTVGEEGARLIDANLVGRVDITLDEIDLTHYKYTLS